MRGDLARRLDKIEAAYQGRATVLHLEDGTKAILPLGAFIDVVFAFMNVMHSEYDGDTFDGTLSWRGKPLRHEWIEAYAHSVPEPGEATVTASARELSRRYLAGEDLTA